MEKKTATYAVTSIIGRREMAAPGVYAYDAEAVVSKAGCDDVYVHVNEYDMFEHYVVSEKSLMDTEEADHEMTDAEKEELTKEFSHMLEDFTNCNGTDAGPESNIRSVSSEYIEEYTKLSQTKESEYYKVFQTLQKVVNLMEG